MTRSRPTWPRTSASTYPRRPSGWTRPLRLRSLGWPSLFPHSHLHLLFLLLLLLYYASPGHVCMLHGPGATHHAAASLRRPTRSGHEAPSETRPLFVSMSREKAEDTDKGGHGRLVLQYSTEYVCTQDLDKRAPGSRWLGKARA